MRILLVHAASRFPHAEKSHPQGIMYLASYLNGRNAAQVELLDMQLDTGNVDSVIDHARRIAPDLVGFSAMTFDAPVLHPPG